MIAPTIPDGDRRSGRARRLCLRFPPARRRLGLAAIGAACALALAHPAAGAPDAQVVGRPGVVDGDTLDFAGRLVHLLGIDAPEVEQTCGPPTAAWPCGQEARWALLYRISPHWVTCLERGAGDDGGVRAICYLAGPGQMDVNAWLVAEGWALSVGEPGVGYDAEEASAQAAQRGLWRSGFEAPWDWRRRQAAGP